MFSETKPPVPVVVDTMGILSPIRILAFSLLRTRSLGLASVDVSPTSRRRLTSRLLGLKPTPMRSRPMPSRLPSVSESLPTGGSGVSENELGNLTPSSLRREAATSSTSTSSSTSGSALSKTASSRSASWMFSGESRSASRLLRSSTKGSRILSIALRKAAAPLGSLLERLNTRTSCSWYSRCFSAVLG